MKKKILLYNPKENTRIRISHIPFSLLTIGSVLKERYEVIIIDARIEKDAKNIIEKNIGSCLFFGITAMSGSPLMDALDAAGYVRALRPDIPIVWGGFHPTLVPETTIVHPLADIIVTGQGEETVLELSDALEKRRPLNTIKGIAYKENDKYFFNGPRPIKDINSFPSLDYSLLDVNKYIKNDADKRTLDYLSSRGCPYSCMFCSINKVYGKRYYFYPALKVIDEVEHLIKTYKINGIRFMDDNFFVSKKRVSDFCDEVLARRLDFKWWAMCRVDELISFDEEFMLKAKKAGLTILNIGAESGSQKILDTISKKISVNMILEAAKICKKYDINVQFSFMAGFPFEDDNDIDATLNLMDSMYKLNHTIDIGLFIYAPTPGTPLYEKSLEGGFKGYSSIEEWGTKSDYFSGSTPWLNAKKKNQLEILSYLIQFVFGTTLQRKLSLIPRLLHKLLSFDAKLRWKLKFLSCPWEWRIIRFIAGGRF